MSKPWGRFFQNWCASQKVQTLKCKPCKPTVPSSLAIMFTGYPWYPRGKVVKVGVCVTKLRHLEQICCQMLMITQQSWLYLIKISMSLGYQFWQGKKGQFIFSLLCFHEALELVEVSNSILAILFKNWLWSYKSTLDSGINVAPWINVAPGTFGKNNERSPLS